MGKMIPLLLATNTGGAAFQTGLLQILSLIAGAVATMMVIYAIYLFIAMATAYDEGKRRAIKKRVINVFASLFIIAALVGTLQALNITFQNVTGSGTNGNNPITPNTPTLDYLAGATATASLSISLESQQRDNKSQPHSSIPYDPYEESTRYTYNRYYSGKITIQASNITLSASAKAKGVTISKITKFTSAFNTSQTQCWTENYWEIGTSGSNLTVLYDYRFGRETRYLIVNQTDGAYAIPFVLEVTAKDSSGTEQTGTLAGTMTLTFKNGVEFQVVK